MAARRSSSARSVAEMSGSTAPDDSAILKKSLPSAEKDRHQVQIHLIHEPRTKQCCATCASTRAIASPPAAVRACRRSHPSRT
jgi:hypothetical protein